MIDQPYPWQIQALEAWQSNGCRGIADVVTGAGKTWFALMAAEKLRQTCSYPVHVFVVVPTCELMEQWRRALQQTFPEEKKIGRIGGGRMDDAALLSQVYVVNSARSCLAPRRDRLLAEGKGVFLIADECHHYGSKQNRRIFQGISAGQERYFTLGLSGTPDSEWFKRVIEPNLGPVICVCRHEEALREQIIAPFYFRSVGVSFAAKENAEYGTLSSKLSILYARLLYAHKELKELGPTAFFRRVQSLVRKEDDTAMAYYYTLLQRRQLVCLAESRLACTLELIRKLPPTARILVFCERILQADALSRLLADQLREPVAKYHSGRQKQNNRQEIGAFRERDARILITCRALDEGMNVPDADVAIVLSGHAEVRQRIQRLGRILRRSGADKTAILYYLYVRESAETPDYLPDARFGAVAASYVYYPAENFFSCPVFEEMALQLLDSLGQQGASTAQLREVRRNLLSGMLLADWQRPPEECRRREVGSESDRNYWKCMGWLAGRWAQKFQNMKEEGEMYHGL